MRPASGGGLLGLGRVQNKTTVEGERAACPALPCPPALTTYTGANRRHRAFWAFVLARVGMVEVHEALLLNAKAAPLALHHHELRRLGDFGPKAVQVEVST